MIWPDFKDWRTWTAGVGAVGAFIGLVVALPKAGAVVEPLVPATRQFVRDENANQDVSLLRARIDIVRISIPQMQAARIQMDDLRAKNPESTLLPLQVKQMDADIASADARLRAMVCELNRSLSPGYIC